VVVIHTDEGLKGFGECSPFMSINGESMETGMVVGKYLAQKLLGMDPVQVEECSKAMDEVIFANNSIKSAIDMALFDIASQAAGLPLYRFLGGKNDKALITDYTVSLGDKHQMAEDALQIKKDGFQVIKVKLGETGKKDVERIRYVREAVGYDIPLRIDANQGWEAGSVIQTLQSLSQFDIQHCEEPIPRWDFMELPRIREQSPIPIMADESCCDHHDAKRLITLKACDLLNVKLGKSSGIFKALKIIRLAEEAGMKIQVGGFLESRLGFTASAHLALTSKNIVWCDFDTPLMLTEDPVSGGISYNQHGVIAVPDQPGLGAWIDSDILKKLSGITID
jgi:L-alanine-DL-glutamate epimerase-like enolase superfamily enzyme